MTEEDSKLKIIFFDGYCGLCNRSVNWLLRHDKQHIFLFASLQGSTAEHLLSKEQRTDLKSIVYFDRGKTYMRSTAVLKCVADLGSGWQWLRVLLFIPRAIRDVLYNLIANNRYKWFGKLETCRLPDESERPYFLP